MEIWPCSRGHVRPHFCKVWHRVQGTALTRTLWYLQCAIRVYDSTIRISRICHTYHLPQVRSISWLAHYKSAGGKSSTSNTYQIASNCSEWWWIWLGMTSPVQFCISSPFIGHLGSNDDVIRSIYVSPYNFWLEWHRDKGLVPKCSSCQDTSFDMRFDLFRSIRDIDLGWPEVKFTWWPFQVTKYMSRSASTRERWWWRNHRSISKREEVIGEKLDEIDVPENGTFFCLTWPGRSTVDLNRSTRTPLDSERPQAIRWSLSRFITLRSEMARGGGGNHPLRCVLVWWKRRVKRARVNELRAISF